MDDLVGEAISWEEHERLLAIERLERAIAEGEEEDRAEAEAPTRSIVQREKREI